MVHTCNPSYWGGRDQEDCSLSQPGQIVHKTLSRKTLHQKRAGGVAQGEGPEFKPQYWKNKSLLSELKEKFPTVYFHATYSSSWVMVHSFLNCKQAVLLNGWKNTQGPKEERGDSRNGCLCASSDWLSWGQEGLPISSELGTVLRGRFGSRGPTGINATWAVQLRFGQVLSEPKYCTL
jgi:hypothetical protein